MAPAKQGGQSQGFPKPGGWFLGIPSLALGAGAFTLPLAMIRPNRLALGTELALADLPLPLLVLWAVLIGCFALAPLWTHADDGSPVRPGLLRVMVPGSLVILAAAVGVLAWVQGEMGPGPLQRLTPLGGLWSALGLWAYQLYLGRTYAATSGRMVVAVALLAFTLAWMLGIPSRISLYQEWWSWRDRFSVELGAHLWMALVPLVPALAVALVLALGARRLPWLRAAAFWLVTGLQTVPSIALFGLFMPLLAAMGLSGLGQGPAMLALFLYGLLPLFRGIWLGLGDVPADTLEAARGMGMSAWQVLLRVELPLALPRLVEGFRLAAVQSIGLASLAALIGGGGLGWFVFQGLGQGSDDLILLGSLGIVALAWGSDRFLALAAPPLWYPWRRTAP